MIRMLPEGFFSDMVIRISEVFGAVLVVIWIVVVVFKKYYINSILYFSNKAHAPMQQQIFHIFLKLKFFVIQTDCKASLIASSG